jgi:hypothetical protein
MREDSLDKSALFLNVTQYDLHLLVKESVVLPYWKASMLRSLLMKNSTLTSHYSIRCHDVNTKVEKGDVLECSLLIYNTEFCLDKVTLNEILKERNLELNSYNVSSVRVPIEVLRLNTKTLTIKFITPLRVKVGGEFFKEAPTMGIILDTLLRRLHTLFSTQLKLDVPSLKEVAKNCAIIDSDVNWKDLTRYSSRQNMRLFFGGISGKVTYSFPDLKQEFLDLKHLLPLIHLGKQTTFGLGEISVI